MADVTKKSPENIIALDGETLRRSFDKASNTKPIHILNACAVESGLYLAQLMVESKTNEIAAVPEMIDLLKSSGAIFTMDALNTQKSILEKVINSGNDYLMPAKGNQKILQSEISAIFKSIASQKALIKVDTEKAHGRIDTRSYQTLSAEGLNLAEDWPGIKSIGMATTESIRGDKTTLETRLFIITFPQNVGLFAQCVRGHWAVENKLHWVLDVTFGEDHSRIRKNHAPRNMSLIRKLAINLLREDKSGKKGLSKQKK